MCRASTPEGERSTCVGCTSNCPDIDLERSYWENIQDPSVRNVYYGFFGLVIGFYTFYYLYSGNWDYYFSGAWTHERDQLASLFKPGMYIFGTAIGIPKVIATPLILGVFVAAFAFLGKGLEALYRHALKSRRIALSEPEIINRCLSFSAYLTINAFYLFGGRPNLMLLPAPALRLVDILIVALTTLWFWQALQHSPTRYRRESLATSLLEQLRKVKVDISKFLEGRKLEELKADEIYVLAKTLPGFSREQRLQAYRNILEDWLRKGKAESSASLELLREVRVEIGVTDDEHRQLLQELGIDGAQMNFDSEAAASYETWLRLENYRSAIEPLLVARLEHGQRLAFALSDPDVAQAIKQYRETYQVSETDHDNVIANITGSGGVLLERARRQLDLLAEDAVLIFGLRNQMLADTSWQRVGAILVAGVARRSAAICAKLFPILLTVGDTPETRAVAARIADLMGDDVELQLTMPVTRGSRNSWGEALEANSVRLLRGGLPENAAGVDKNAAGKSFRDVVLKSGELVVNLQRIATGDDQLIGAIALTAISYIDRGLAQGLAAVIRQGPATHWLMTEVVGSLSNNLAGKAAEGTTAPEQAQHGAGYVVEKRDALSKLLGLSGTSIFGQLELNALAEIAASAEVRRYNGGTWLCCAGEPSSDAFLLASGTADVLSAGDEALIRTLDAGAIIGELGVITGRPRTVSVRIASPASVVTINGERLRWIMENDASVSLGMLSVVAGYAKV
jgi:hypothetical protein